MKFAILHLLLPAAIIFSDSSSIMFKSQPYLLNVNDTKFVEKGANRYMIIKVSLKNNSTDTLKYLSMTCDSDFYYRYESKELSWDDEMSSCTQNIPIIIAVPPGGSSGTHLKLKINRLPFTYRIKLYLVISRDDNPAWDFLFGKNDPITVWTKRITHRNTNY